MIFTLRSESTAGRARAGTPANAGHR